MEEKELSRSLLRRLLANGEPEVGARLKQRMLAEFRQHGWTFDHRAWGYAKFTDYLVAQHDLVRLEGLGEPGDVSVMLTNTAGTLAGVSRTRVAPPERSLTQQPRIRNDLWQAFTNPDDDRKRFFHRPSGKIRHYLKGQPSAVQSAVAAEPGEFIQIPHIPGTTHLQWMEDYLKGLELSEPEKLALHRMLEGTYSSRLNTLFTTALGEQAIGWRRQRTRLVASHIRTWAKKHGLPSDSLIHHRRAAEWRPQVGGNAIAAGTSMPRHRIDVLLGLLSEEDLNDVVLPMLLSVVWTKSRQGK